MKIGQKYFPLLALLLITCTPALADVVIYEQMPTLDGNVYASQNDVNGFGNFATVYDNFKTWAQIPYQLTDVHWVGGYFNPPQQGPIQGWTISFYADAGNQVGNLLWSQHFTTTVTEDYLGMFNGTPLFSYHQDDIVDGLLLQPNTEYWLSLVPDLGFPPQWGWGTGTGGDGLSYQTFNGDTEPLPVDFAFDISASIPEPGTLLLLGSGLAGMAAMLRRKLC
jgi:hypothetical protein